MAPSLVSSLLLTLLTQGELSKVPCVMVHLQASTEPQVTPEEVGAGENQVLGQTQPPETMLTLVAIHGPKKPRQSINGPETVNF